MPHRVCNCRRRRFTDRDDQARVALCRRQQPLRSCASCPDQPISTDRAHPSKRLSARYSAVMTIPETRPLGPTVADWSDFRQVMAISWAARWRAVRKQRAMLAALIAVPTAYTAYIVATTLVFGTSWALAVGGWAAFMLVAILLVIGEVLCHTAWRLLDRRRIVLLSSTRGAALDVQFNKDVVTFSNHGRLPRDTSAAVLRAEVARWVGALPHRVEVKAQNTQVAELYTKQFPELTAGEPDALGRIPLTVTV